MHFIYISFVIAFAIVAAVVQANDSLLKGIIASNGTDATGMKAGFIEGKGLDKPAVCPHQATCTVSGYEGACVSISAGIFSCIF